MKKTLLIAAAALAAGIISSEAQVYSQNIVGYVNKPLPLGFSTVSIPLAGSPSNALTNTIPNTGALDGANLYIYTGTSFQVLTFDSTIQDGGGNFTGFADQTDSTAVPTPVIAPGVAFFINNNTGTALTNAFVGTVSIASVPGTVTNNLVAGKRFVASVIPFAGGISSSLNLTNSGPDYALDGTQVFIPNIFGSPLAVHGYNVVTFDHSFATGFGDVTDSTQVPEPTIPVSSGFIFDNNAGLGTVKWVQGL